jgi:hypothetical protein
MSLKAEPNSDLLLRTIMALETQMSSCYVQERFSSIYINLFLLATSNYQLVAESKFSELKSLLHFHQSILSQLILKVFRVIQRFVGFKRNQ